MLCVTGVKLDCHVPILCSVVNYFRPDSILESVSTEESTSPGAQALLGSRPLWSPERGSRVLSPLCAHGQDHDFHSVLQRKCLMSTPS